MEQALVPNDGKNLLITVNGDEYYRFPIKTKVVESGDDLTAILKECALPYMKDGDFLFMSEKIVAISQGRAFHIDSIKPSRLAKFLVKFVYRSPYGIGLGSVWTMELAIREIGRPRILLAAFLSAITKPFGMRGVFYKVCGHGINAIDGPCDYTLPPYNKYAKLAPKDPDKVARRLKAELGHDVYIVDANDLGVNILGKSDKNVPDSFLEQIFGDNPLGQASQQTPVAIIRKKEAE